MKQLLTECKACNDLRYNGLHCCAAGCDSTPSHTLAARMLHSAVCSLAGRLNRLYVPCPSPKHVLAKTMLTRCTFHCLTATDHGNGITHPSSNHTLHALAADQRFDHPNHMHATRCLLGTGSLCVNNIRSRELGLVICMAFTREMKHIACQPLLQGTSNGTGLTQHLLKTAQWAENRATVSPTGPSKTELKLTQCSIVTIL